VPSYGLLWKDFIFFFALPTLYSLHLKVYQVLTEVVTNTESLRCLLRRYVRQFREIFTEEGRRQVKITHQVTGRAPAVTYTQVCNTAALTTKSAATGSAAQLSTSAAKVNT